MGEGGLSIQFRKSKKSAQNVRNHALGIGNQAGNPSSGWASPSSVKVIDITDPKNAKQTIAMHKQLKASGQKGVPKKALKLLDENIKLKKKGQRKGEYFAITGMQK